jgi:hypothetical protein
MITSGLARASLNNTLSGTGCNDNDGGYCNSCNSPATRLTHLAR